jgi:DNA-binding CsgD family transcriptional regulator
MPDIILKENAAARAIAENTVKNHMRNILEKLHLENRVQVAAFALGRKTSGRSPAVQ